MPGLDGSLLHPGLSALTAPLRLAPLALAAAVCLPAQATAASPVVSTEPSLQPGFKRAISDYVVRCPDRSLTVAVRRARRTKIMVAGRRTRKQRTVAIEPGRAVPILVRQRDRLTRHFVRCLPDDFPSWSYRHVGPQTPRWYLVTPTKRPDAAGGPGQFVVIFDHHGVPVWWYRPPRAELATRDARLMNGKIVYAETDGRAFSTGESSSYRILRPDGTPVRTIRTVGSPTDFHDIQRLGEHYLVLTYRARDHVDLSPYGGPPDASVVDSEIQRISRRGRVVWSWNSSDHIGLEETGRNWDLLLEDPVTLPDGREVYDPTHINSVERVGRDLIISLRNVDAVYRIRMRDGRIRWKLGGTQTRRSLRVVGDPADYPLGAQHDARLWRGTLTVHDNRTLLDDRQPRVVRYAIDTKRRRAILRESIMDPPVTSSGCCGSARKLANGDWVIGWGFSSSSAVLTPRGSLVNRLALADDWFSYRTVPAPARAISAQTLREGMDVVYRSGAAS